MTEGSEGHDQPTVPLSQQVRAAIHAYFANLNGNATRGLYDLVLEQVEQPLIATVLEHTGGNQTRAAEILGINRTTLRKKIRQYQLE